MKLFFVNVECEVRNETRLLSDKQCAKNPYRTFVYAVMAESEQKAIAAAPTHEPANWYEIKRYTQDPRGSAGVEDALFVGATDHDRKRYPAECPEAA